MKEDKFTDSIKMISAHTDLQIFVDENRSREDESDLLKKEVVHLYEHKSRPLYGPNGTETIKHKSESDEYKDLNLPSREELDGNINFVKNKIKNMIKQQTSLTMEDKVELLSMLHHKEVNYRVTDELKTITDVKEYHVLRDLSELVNYMITESINDKHNDFRIINNILCSASSIYCRKNAEGVSQIK